MSTILNALRRLEEDSETSETRSPDSLPTTDPQATHALRSRILQEEQAAAARAEEHKQSPLAQPLPRALAAAALLLTAIALGLFVIAPRFTTTESPIAPTPSRTDQNPSALVALPPAHQPQTIARTNPPAEASRPPRPAPPPPSIPVREPSNEPRMAAAAVTPTTAMREATAVIQTANPPAPPREMQARPRPNLNLARTASVAAPPNAARSARSTPSTAATPSSSSSPSTRSTATRIDRSPVGDEAVATNASTGSTHTRPSSEFESPAKSTAHRVADNAPDRAAEPSVQLVREVQHIQQIQQVQQHTAPPTPDIAILQTAWHPSPDHRSAKIRVLESDETLTLHEGDAVGPLVVQQITPSAVIFLSGDIELRLRVGRPDSGS